MIVQIQIPDLPWHAWVALYLAACFVWGFSKAAGKDLYDRWARKPAWQVCRRCKRLRDTREPHVCGPVGLTAEQIARGLEIAERHGLLKGASVCDSCGVPIVPYPNRDHRCLLEDLRKREGKHGLPQ